MSKTIEITELIEDYGEREACDIINLWQDGDGIHPMTCLEHGDVILIFHPKGKVLSCPREDCFYHQHWIPTVVIDYWKEYVKSKEDEMGISYYG